MNTLCTLSLLHFECRTFTFNGFLHSFRLLLLLRNTQNDSIKAIKMFLLFSQGFIVKTFSRSSKNNNLCLAFTTNETILTVARCVTGCNILEMALFKH